MCFDYFPVLWSSYVSYCNNSLSQAQIAQKLFPSGLVSNRNSQATRFQTCSAAGFAPKDQLQIIFGYLQKKKKKYFRAKPTLSTSPLGGNQSTRRKPTTFGRALSDCYKYHVSAVRTEPTIQEVKGACSEDCVTEDPMHRVKTCPY